MNAKDPLSQQAIELPVMPSLGTFNSQEEYDVNKYVVRYLKANLADDMERSLLSEIETRGIRGDGIVLLNTDKYVFMDQYVVVLKYMEKVSK